MSSAAHDNAYEPIVVGRYLLHREIARGGMATIHLARMVGDVGFSRLVAAKRLLPELAEDGQFVTMFLDEARIASKVHHRNVVPVLDVITIGREVVLVQEYVRGVPLSWLLRHVHVGHGAHVPVPIAVAIGIQVLAGLHAAHETVDEMGMPLRIVHRDVSPQNIMIAADGTARLLDFGVAKAAVAAHTTRQGSFKGKLAYTAPEQLQGTATRQSDVYALSVVLWELLAGKRMRRSRKGGDVDLIEEIRAATVPPPTIIEAMESHQAQIALERWAQLEALSPVIERGLAVEPRDRWLTAAELQDAIVNAASPATNKEVAQWLKTAGGEFLDGRDRLIADEEASWRRRALAAPHDSETLTTNVMPPTVLPVGSNIRPAEKPAAPRHRALLVLGGSLVVAAGILLGARMVGGGDAPAPDAPKAPAVAPPVPVTVTPPVTAPPVAVPDAAELVPDAAPASLEPIDAGVLADAAEPPDAAVVPHTVRHPPPHIVRVPPHPVAHPAQVKTPPPTPPTPPTKGAKSKPGCDPPYYFEGTKKIFKAQCL